MNKLIRSPGYYWVQEFEDDPFIISYWDGLYWTHSFDLVSDDCWNFIDENQILRESNSS